MSLLINELRDALATMTPGAWYTDDTLRGMSGKQKIVEFKYECDAIAIVALVNAAPALLARLEEAEADRDHLRALHAQAQAGFNVVNKAANELEAERDRLRMQVEALMLRLEGVESDLAELRSGDA